MTEIDSVELLAITGGITPNPDYPEGSPQRCAWLPFAIKSDDEWIDMRLANGAASKDPKVRADMGLAAIREYEQRRAHLNELNSRCK